MSKSKGRILDTYTQIKIVVALILTTKERRNRLDMEQGISVIALARKSGLSYHAVHSAVNKLLLPRKVVLQLKGDQEELVPRYRLTEEGEQSTLSELKQLYDLLRQIFPV